MAPRKQPRPRTTLFSADRMMQDVAKSLARDFQDSMPNAFDFSDLYDALHHRDVKRIRQAISAIDCNRESVAEFKALYQVQSILKRYRFSKDLYTDDELTQQAIDLFVNVQSHIRAIDLNAVDEVTTAVLDLARIYIADTLGVYDGEEHRRLCRFGRRASVGVPARAACEAARWELPVSGSQEQIDWFDSEMSQIDCVQEYWANQRAADPLRPTYQLVDSLALTLVPKTFKSLRSIMPNTTIGSYMSLGLGEMMRKRLSRKGYNLSTLQTVHRKLAREASVHNLYTTTDLSSASDTISVALVERLFPSDWLAVLHQSRIGKVSLPDGTIVASETFCTMGIGYTFPLQTLVFLALLKAIEAILNNRRINRRRISVYGDDMIYCSSLHNTVLHVFKQIGFVINLDKTFHEGHFRESCGGDYYHGVDVRPFQPRNGAACVGPKTYEAMLYKFINGLLMRWSEHEIGGTLKYLTSQLVNVTQKIKRVPSDYPDDSGIKCPTLHHWAFLNGVHCAALKNLGHGVYRFPYLRLVPADRKEERHGPFLWARMRGNVEHCPYDSDQLFPKLSLSIVARVVDEVTGAARETTPIFITREDRPIATFRSKISGRRLRRTSTYVTISNTGRYMRRSGTSCFEDRRQDQP